MFNWRKRQAKNLVADNNLFATPFEKNIPQSDKEALRYALDHHDPKLAADYLSDLQEAAKTVSQVPGQTFDIEAYLNAKLGWRSLRLCYHLEFDFYYGLVISEYHVQLFCRLYFYELILPKKLMDTEDFFELVISTRFDNEFDPAHNLSVALACCPPSGTAFEGLLDVSEREALLEKYCRYFQKEVQFLAEWQQLKFVVDKYPMITLLFQKYLPLN